MSVAGTEPPQDQPGAARQPSGPPRRPDPHPDRYAAGQLLGLGIVLLISLPLLPVLLLLVLWLRLRHRRGATPL